MKRTTFKNAKQAKCDFCKSVQRIEFKYQSFLDEKEEILNGEIEVCRHCAQILDKEFDMAHLEEEIELNRVVLF